MAWFPRFRSVPEARFCPETSSFSSGLASKWYLSGTLGTFAALVYPALEPAALSDKTFTLIPDGKKLSNWREKERLA